MSKRYLLPCENCDQRIPIETTQAGQTIRCSGCQTELKVGTLREIRSLATDEPTGGEATSSAQGAQRRMSVASRALFVTGLAITVFGLIVGVINRLEYQRLYVETPEMTIPEDFRRQLMAVPPAELKELWEKEDEAKVAEWKEHPFLQVQSIARGHLIYSWIGFGFAAIGIVTVVIAFLLPRTAAE